MGAGGDNAGLHEPYGPDAVDGETAIGPLVGVVGIALATLSTGRIAASIPLPARWRERRIGVKPGVSMPILIVAVALLLRWPGPATLFGFGLTSGWINILTWAWLGRATGHPRPFGLAAMVTKIGLLASIPLASRMAG